MDKSLRVGHSTLSDRYCSGGPAGVIYSFIVVWAGNLATFASLAELASM